MLNVAVILNQASQPENYSSMLLCFLSTYVRTVFNKKVAVCVLYVQVCGVCAVCVRVLYVHVSERREDNTGRKKENLSLNCSYDTVQYIPWDSKK